LKRKTKSLNTTVIEKLQQKMMNTKKLFSVFAFLAIIVLSLSVVSALSLGSTSNDLTESQSSTTLTLTNTNTTDMQNVTFSISSIISGSNQVIFNTPAAISNLAASGTSPVTVSYSSIIGDFDFGRYDTTLTATGTSSSATQTITFQKGFCESGEVGGNLSIKDINIDNTGTGDEDEWFLLDDLEIEVEVENDGDIDIDEIIIELGLFNSDGENIIDDLDFENDDEEKIDAGDIEESGEDDELTERFIFRVPADLEDENYKLTVKAYSDDLGESVECTDTASELDTNDIYKTIDVEREDDEGKFIAFEDNKLSVEEATCGEEITLDTTIFNIGDEDQDRVRVNLRNTKLGLDMTEEITSDLDKGDDSDVTFTFTVPNDAEDGTHLLVLTAEYDYKKSSGAYRESSDEEKRIPLKVIGCGTPSTPTEGRIATIAATLESDAVAGRELIVKSEITNIAGSTRSFVVDATGYDSWATLESISQRLITLSSGNSREVTFTFLPNRDATAEQKTFVISAQSGEVVETREVAVTLESPATGFSSLFAGGNTLIWTIGIINIVLIILIIIVAVSLARR
tara:strand:- start:8 stop:1720 length:1713 start_codon:yes stop_codon:yes gene_type:complete